MVNGLPPLGYTTWVFVVAAAVGVGACWLRGAKPRYTRWFLVFTLFTGALRCAVPVTIIAVAVQHIPAGLMVMITSTSSIMVYGAAIALRRERFHWVRFAGVLLGLVGIGCILLPQSSLPGSSDLTWVVLAFAAPALFALTTMTIDVKRPPDTPTLALTAAMFVWAALGLAPTALLTDSFYLPLPPFRLADGSMVLHGLINGIAFIGMFELIRAAGAVVATQTSYITPVSGVIWGVVLLGERHSAWIWAALVLILAGLFFVNYGRGSRRPHLTRAR
jgi:drug/metabolite transporter (DMT)-like permease